MRWYITRKKLWLTILALFVAVVLIAVFSGCTKREEQAAQQTGGTISRAVGLPSFVGESIALLVCNIITYFAGEKRGRTKERKHKAPEAKAAT